MMSAAVYMPYTKLTPLPLGSGVPILINNSRKTLISRTIRG